MASNFKSNPLPESVWFSGTPYAMDRTLIYFTGGFAFGEVESKGHFLRTPFDVTETQTGYVLGGGLKYKINPAWSIKGEYQFLSLDASDLNGAGPLNDGGADRSVPRERERWAGASGSISRNSHRD